MGSDVQQPTGNVFRGQTLMVVVVGEQIPGRVEDQSAIVSRAPGHDLQLAAVRSTAKHTSGACVQAARSLRLAEHGPVSPMVCTCVVTIPDHQITHRDIEITFWPPRQAVESLVHMPIRAVPKSDVSVLARRAQ